MKDQEPFEINAVPYGRVLRSPERAVVQSDAPHVLQHLFEGGSEDCERCQRFREDQAQYERDNPPCDCDCCDHNGDR